MNPDSASRTSCGSPLLPSLRINVDNPSSCFPGGYVPPQFKSLFVDSKRCSDAAYSGSALSETYSIITEDEPEQLPGSKKIAWSGPVMPLNCTAAQLLRWWTSGASSYEFIPPENVLLKAQIEALCGGNVCSLEREREQADPFRDIFAPDRRIFGIPECVAYAQLDVECGFLLPARDRIYFADICGISAFSEFVITRRGKAAKGWIVRSAGDDHFSPARMNNIARTLLSAQADCKYAPADAECRSLLQESVRLEIIDHVRAVSGDGVDIVTAAWAPECSREKARSVGVLCARFVAQLLLAFDLCAQGGTLVVRLFTSTDPVVLGLVPLIASCFEASAIVKPLATSPYNAVRFLVCKGMMQHIDDTSGIRPVTSAFLSTAVKKLESGDAAWLAGPSPLLSPPLATKFVVQANDSIDDMVLRMWTRAAALKNGNTAADKNVQSKSNLRAQLAAKLASWAVPDKSLLQQKNELIKLGLDPSEQDSLAKNMFMNSSRMALLQSNKGADPRPPVASQPHKIAVPSPQVVAIARLPEAAPQHRPAPSSAAPVSHAPKSHSSATSASSSSATTSKKKKNDAEAFVQANELDGNEPSALPSVSKQLPSANAPRASLPSRAQTSQVNPEISATSPAAPPKAAAKLPAPLLAAAKKAGMSVANFSSKATKAPPGQPLSRVSAAESAGSNPPQSFPVVPSAPKEAHVDVAPATVSVIAATKSTDAVSLVDHNKRNSTGKAVDRNEGLSSSSKAAPAIPIRRKRIIDSDDSDDAPATPASLPPVTVAAPSVSDVPAASPASVSSAKRPRVIISSSRELATATVNAVANEEESVAGAREVEELLASKAAIVVVSGVAEAANDAPAPSKSGLRIALKRRISD